MRSINFNPDICNADGEVVRMLTLDEKREKLQEFCNKHVYCDDCAIAKQYEEHMCDDEYCFYDEFGERTPKVSDMVVKKYYDFLLLDVKEIEDNVNHPNHYETGKFECIEVMEEAIGTDAVKDFCVCNAFKYIYRHKRKNGKEDLEKARWYINKYLELCEKE